MASQPGRVVGVVGVARPALLRRGGLEDGRERAGWQAAGAGRVRSRERRRAGFPLCCPGTTRGAGGLADRIAAGLQKAGNDLKALKTSDLAAIDEFHFRGRKATLQLAGKMNLSENSRVLDIGSGLGGAARTLAEEYRCHVTGIDLTEEFCETAEIMSAWVGLAERTEFLQGDATNLPFADAQFDAAMTIHVAMRTTPRPGPGIHR